MVRSGSNYDISIKSEIEIKSKERKDFELVETTKLDKELVVSLKVDVKTLKYAFGYNERVVDDRVKTKSIASEINNLDLRNVALFRNVNTVLGYSKTGYGVHVTRVGFDGESMWLSPYILEDTLPHPFEVSKQQFEITFLGMSLAAIIDKMAWQFETHLWCESTTTNLGVRRVGHLDYENDGLNNNYPDLGIRRYVINASLNAKGLELDWCALVTNLRKDKRGKWEPGEISGEFCIPWEPLLLSRTVKLSHLLKMRKRLAEDTAL